MTTPLHFTLTIPEDLAGSRLDVALARLLPEHSRSTLQRWIREKAVIVDGHPAIAKQKVEGHETIQITATPAPQPAWQAQPMTLDIVFEDDHVLVINKPAGLVVHPAAGHPDQTLLNALLHHVPSVRDLPRAGLIHRLDRDTSGLLIIAKTPLAL